jgi:transcription termination factor Rho
MYDILELNKKLVPELREIAKELKIKRAESYKKQDLIYKILDTQAIQEAEKNVKKIPSKEERGKSKEERSIKNFLRKKPDTSRETDTPGDESTERGNRRRRERIEPVLKHEKIEANNESTETPKSPIQSRQDQIKAIIQGFNLEKSKNKDDQSKHKRKKQEAKQVVIKEKE